MIREIKATEDLRERKGLLVRRETLEVEERLVSKEQEEKRVMQDIKDYQGLLVCQEKRAQEEVPVPLEEKEPKET